MAPRKYFRDYRGFSIEDLQNFIRARSKDNKRSFMPTRRCGLYRILFELDQAVVFPFQDLPAELRNIVYEQLLLHNKERNIYPDAGIGLLATNRAIGNEARAFLLHDSTPTMRIHNGEIETWGDIDYDGKPAHESSIYGVKQLHIQVSFYDRPRVRILRFFGVPIPALHPRRFFTPAVPDQQHFLRCITGIVNNFPNLRRVTLVLERPCALPLRAFRTLAQGLSKDCVVVFGEGFDIHQEGVAHYEEVLAERKGLQKPSVPDDLGGHDENEIEKDKQL